jgi:hypothetical protein
VKSLANPFTPNTFPGKKSPKIFLKELVIEKAPFNLDERSIDLSMAQTPFFNQNQFYNSFASENKFES